MHRYYVSAFQRYAGYRSPAPRSPGSQRIGPGPVAGRLPGVPV
jgi:hypothetical protein